MAVELNHTIVPAHDPQASAQFLADILGLPVDPPVAHFTPVTLANGVSLDFDHHDHVDEHHYAFQLSDEEFQAAFGRICRQGHHVLRRPRLPPARPGLCQQERPPRHLFPGPERPPHGDPHPHPRRDRHERTRRADRPGNRQHAGHRGGHRRRVRAPRGRCRRARTRPGRRGQRGGRDHPRRRQGHGGDRRRHRFRPGRVGAPPDRGRLGAGRHPGRQRRRQLHPARAARADPRRRVARDGRRQPAGYLPHAEELPARDEGAPPWHDHHHRLSRGAPRGPPLPDSVRGCQGGHRAADAGCRRSGGPVRHPGNCSLRRPSSPRATRAGSRPRCKRRSPMRTPSNASAHRETFDHRRRVPRLRRGRLDHRRGRRRRAAAPCSSDHRETRGDGAEPAAMS